MFSSSKKTFLPKYTFALVTYKDITHNKTMNIFAGNICKNTVYAYHWDI